MKKHHFQLISLFLVIVMLATALASCIAEDEDDKETKASQKATEKATETQDDFLNNSNQNIGNQNNGYQNNANQNNGNQNNSSTDNNGGTGNSGDTGNNSDNENNDGTLTVFKNGEYKLRLIRSDMSNAFDKSIYTDIRMTLKEFTKVLPSLNTDFVAAGTEKYDGPAILVGSTNYKETKELYKTLENNQAKAVLVGNKYVMVWNDITAGEQLLSSFSKKLEEISSKDEIIITDAWNITITNSFEDSGDDFDESGLITSAILPNLGTSYNAGQGSQTYIKTGSNQGSFDTLCGDIEAKGFRKYTSNTIGDNKFVTYVTQTQIVHVMFFPSRSEIRTAVDKRGTGMNGFSLPALASQNEYTKIQDSEMIVCDISNADWPGGMCIIFKLSDGRFFIIDSGIGGKMSDGRSYVGSSSGWIYATLAKHADDPKNIQVAAWLITHVHSDHAGGLYDMALGYHGKKGGSKHTVMPKEAKEYIKIDQIIYNAPDNFPDCNREGWMKIIIEGFNVKNVVKAHPGQVFYFADLTFTIYGAQDLMLEKSGKSGDLNDFSLSLKAEFNGKKALFLGDSDTIPNPVLAQIYKHELKADLLQLSHHGYGDTGDADVNSYCNPSMVLWCVSNADLRSGQKINVNSSIATLDNVKHYKPGTGNLIFKSDWTTYTESRDTIMNLIPTCDGTYCGNSDCTTKTSFLNIYT